MGERLWLVRRFMYGFGALIILLFALAVTNAPSSNRPVPSSRELPRPNEDEAQEDTNHDPAQPHGSTANPVFVQVLPEKKTKAETRKEKYESEEKPSLDRGLTTYTLWLAIFTAALFAAASAQVGLFWWQLRLIRDSIADGGKAAKAAQASADVAKQGLIASQRAWVKAGMELVGGRLFFDNSGGVGIDTTVRMKNVGKEPAINIRIRTKMRVIGRGESPFVEDMVAEQCEEFRHEPDRLMFSLFPDEEAPPTKENCIRWGTSVSKKELLEGIVETGDDRYGSIIFVVFYGAVSYQSPSDGETIHQTRFYYDLMRKDGEPIMAGKTVPSDEIMLSDRSYSLRSNAD